MCECGLLKDERGTTGWRVRRTLAGHEDRVRDSVAGQIRRMGELLTWKESPPQWSKEYKDTRGTYKHRLSRIDVVPTIPGRDELQWLDIRRPTAAANVEGVATSGGFSALFWARKRKRQSMGTGTRSARTR